MDNAEIINEAREYINVTLPEETLGYTEGRIGKQEHNDRLHARMEFFQRYRLESERRIVTRKPAGWITFFLWVSSSNACATA